MFTLEPRFRAPSPVCVRPNQGFGPLFPVSVVINQGFGILLMLVRYPTKVSGSSSCRCCSRNKVSGSCWCGPGPRSRADLWSLHGRAGPVNKNQSLPSRPYHLPQPIPPFTNTSLHPLLPPTPPSLIILNPAPLCPCAPLECPSYDLYTLHLPPPSLKSASIFITITNSSSRLEASLI